MVKANHNKTQNRPIFYVIMVILPLIILIVIELLLRLSGFGKTTPLFIPNPAHPEYLLARPDVMTRYFPFSKNPPQVTMEADFFLAQKPEKSIRIFVQGGSTAAGFPYGLGASLSGTLEQRLRQSWPQHQVELINTAMSAVNSHTLLDFADEIIAQQPDMILIYAGHNEFLGIMGASSNFSKASSYWLTRLLLSAKDLRLLQAFQWAYSKVFEQPVHKNSSANDPNTSTMMAKVAANQSIALNSDVYDAGLAQFSNNLSALLAKYQQAGIPVFISNIASNEKDQPPFKSLKVEDKYQALFADINSAQNKLTKDQILNISNTLINSHSADLHYQLGRILYRFNLHKQARKHFNLAIDHDLLKFRAPGAINQIIEQVALTHQANFIDVHSYFKNRSANNIVGNELMLEHLHPNLRGYFVLGEAFYQALERAKPITPWRSVPIQQAWTQRLVLPSEEYNGFAMIQQLMSGYPFVDTPKTLSLPKPSDNAQALGLAYFNKEIDWLGMMEANLAQYRANNNSKMMLKTLQILADAMPHNGLYSEQAAELLAKNGEIALAIFYYQRAQIAGGQQNIANKVQQLKTQL